MKQLNGSPQWVWLTQWASPISIGEEMTQQRSARNNTRPRGFTPWLWVVGISVVLAFVVPYALLPLFANPLATYLFWTGFSVFIAGFVIWGVARWRDQ